MYRYRQQIYNFYMYRVETVWGAMWYRPRDSFYTIYRAVGSGHSESGSGYVLVRFVYVKISRGRPRDPRVASLVSSV